MQLFCAIVALVTCATALDTDVTPVQKVIQLLNGMLEKGKKEKHDEQVQFAAYDQFCKDTSTEKGRSIKEASEKIEMLKADIQKATADTDSLTKEIAELEEDVSVWGGDKKQQQRFVRSRERIMTKLTRITRNQWTRSSVRWQP
jgi:predicted RNase H-like nuclease (RuvC/YqgF family)